jgi:hypothetical protein
MGNLRAVKEIFAWMNPISGMFRDNSGYADWRGNFDATKDIQFDWPTAIGSHAPIMSAYIVRGENEDFEIIILGQWDFPKQTGWHSSDLKEEG